MEKNGYEAPIVWLLLFEDNDIVTASNKDVGVNGDQQEGWWGND